MTFPATVEELMQFLNERYPEPQPRPGEPLDQVMWDAGRRSVFLELKQLREAAVHPLLREKRGQGRVRRQDT